MPRSAIEEMLTQADAAFAQLLQDSTSSPQFRSRHALLLMVFADQYGIIGKTERQWDTALVKKGDLKGAGEAYRASLSALLIQQVAPGVRHRGCYEILRGRG